MNKRVLISGFVTVLVLLGIGGNLLLTTPPATQDPPRFPIDTGFDYPINETLLDELADNLVSGGPGPDGIPAIENPVYISVAEANDFLDNSDIVFGLNYSGEYLAYPQKILVWHEIVNDLVGGEQISITYCPLTGSSIAYKGELEAGNTTFGTSGALINSNLVMYDRTTTSYWPQIFSQSFQGSQRGVRLERIHVVWTNWSLWKQAHPDSLVLSTDTGFARGYNYDPYGSYQENDSYYQRGFPVFPVMHEDDRLLPKEVVIGVDLYSAQYAVTKQYMRDNKVANLQVGNESVALFYDSSLDTVRAFSSLLNNQSFTYTYTDDNIVDVETSSVWSPLGFSHHGSLFPVDSFDVMWFAWSAFYPNTGLLCFGCDM